MPNISPAVFFADDDLGADILEWVLNHFPQDVLAVVYRKDGDRSKQTRTLVDHFQTRNKFKILDDGEEHKKELAHFLDTTSVDYIFLLWWPVIVDILLTSKPKIGTVNTHPSLLPYCRGKDPNFWSIVEETPFGVSLHFVTDKIDKGPIIAQKQITITWNDTGETLHKQSKQQLLQLFKETYPAIREKRFQVTFPKEAGSIHFRRELEPMSEIKLDQTYTARQLLNLLRARTYPPYPACSFDCEGKKFEVRVNITEIPPSI
jgi:methionyl-tRNA formyltransferase